MSTNFYLKGHRGSDSDKYHVGVRRAAGPYCWDCKVTLRKGGESKVHTGSAHDDPNDLWHDRCPECGKPRIREDLSESANGRELGFNTSPHGKKTGVRSCSSFLWFRELGRVQKIVDEYGREYSREEFLKMLEECPIQFREYQEGGL